MLCDPVRRVQTRRCHSWQCSRHPDLHPTRTYTHDSSDSTGAHIRSRLGPRDQHRRTGPWTSCRQLEWTPRPQWPDCCRRGRRARRCCPGFDSGYASRATDDAEGSDEPGLGCEQSKRLLLPGSSARVAGGRCSKVANADEVRYGRDGSRRGPCSLLGRRGSQGRHGPLQDATPGDAERIPRHGQAKSNGAVWGRSRAGQEATAADAGERRSKSAPREEAKYLRNAWVVKKKIGGASMYVCRGRRPRPVVVYTNIFFLFFFFLSFFHMYFFFIFILLSLLPPSVYISNLTLFFPCVPGASIPLLHLAFLFCVCTRIPRGAFWHWKAFNFSLFDLRPVQMLFFCYLLI